MGGDETAWRRRRRSVEGVRRRKGRESRVLGSAGRRAALVVVMRPAVQLGSLRLWRALHRGAVLGGCADVSVGLQSRAATPLRSPACPSCCCTHAAPNRACRSLPSHSPTGDPRPARRPAGLVLQYSRPPRRHLAAAVLPLNPRAPPQRCVISRRGPWLFGRAHGRRIITVLTLHIRHLYLSKIVFNALFLNPSIGNRPPNPSCARK